MSPTRRAFSVAVYPRHQGRALLIRHKRLGAWLPPGGECEPGETPLEAAARELREETGLVGRFPSTSTIDGTPPGLIGYEEHPAGSKGTHLNFVFVADVDTEEVRPNAEFDQWRWVARMGELEAPPNVGQLLELALRGDLQAVARRWIQAFNERDLETLLSLYAEDAVHLSPKLRARAVGSAGKIVGKAALRSWWADAFGRLPGLRYELRRLTADGERVWMEYQRQVPGEPPMEIAESLELRDGLIRASTVFHG